MDTQVTLEILKKLRDHANGQDIKLPPPGMVQKAIETCIEWGESESQPKHFVKTEVGYSSTWLQHRVNSYLAKLREKNAEVVSIQYQVNDREQEHHLRYNVMIHYKV